jgi:hypothetical protein
VLNSRNILRENVTLYHYGARTIVFKRTPRIVAQASGHAPALHP